MTPVAALPGGLLAGDFYVPCPVKETTVSQKKPPTLRQLWSDAEARVRAHGHCTLAFPTWSEVGAFVRAMRRDRAPIDVNSIYPMKRSWHIDLVANRRK